MGNITEIASQFNIPGDIREIVPWGNGLVNHTYRIRTERGTDYLLQQVNTSVYADIDGIMENIARVTEMIEEHHFHLSDGRPKPMLRLIRTKEGKPYLKDGGGDSVSPEGFRELTGKCAGVWRVYNFIPDAYSIETADTAEQVRQAGVILGQFHYLLRDFPVETMRVPEADFHNPARHYRKLLTAAERDTVGHREEVEKELQIIREHAGLFDELNRAKIRAGLPLRVNHNDPKINNIMFDRKTDEPLCMVDLDTMMPGYIPYDFGDAVRSVMCTGKDTRGRISENTGENLRGEKQDDPDNNLIPAGVFRRDFYDRYKEGFLEGAQGILTSMEEEHLMTGTRLIFWESAMRYLADDLNGDIYLKVHYPRQNLVKARMHLRAALELD